VIGTFHNKIFYWTRCGLVGCWLLALAWTVAAAESPEAVQTVMVDEIAVLRQAQQAEERWAEEKSDLRADYETLQAERAQLEKQTAALAAEIDGRRGRLEEMERQRVESARIEAELQGLLETIVHRLEEAVGRDLPFLPTERSERLAALKAFLARPDADLSEKCRRAMEALQVETQYGYGLEVDETQIDFAGRPLVVEVLRVGRLALFFRTPDGRTIGWYDRAEAAWKPLAGRYAEAIHQTCDMALRRRPVDLVKLPLGRITAP